MKRAQFLFLCGLTALGSFAGGLVGQMAPRVANAQTQTRTENFLLVPNGGLRLVNQQNRTIGVIAEQGGNGGLVLFNSAGRPSLSLSAGTAGRIVIDAANGPTVKLMDPAGKDSITLNAAPGKSSIDLREALQLSAGSDGGKINLGNGSGSNLLRFDSSPQGGRVTGFDKGQTEMFRLQAGDGEGAITLSDKSGASGFQAGGKGSAQVSREKETLWKVPSGG